MKKNIEKIVYTMTVNYVENGKQISLEIIASSPKDLCEKIKNLFDKQFKFNIINIFK